ncbi:MAG TPA: hypothetical protein DIT18_15375 [Pseudomonas sp.]|nr:hypothetical protein [Pseudomonas sp.]
MNADVGAVGGGLMPGMTLDTRFNQRGINGSKSLYKSIVNQFDDSTVDFLGKTLDMVAGPNTLIQKFIPPMVSETEIVSLVALPVPGRENLFS